MLRLILGVIDQLPRVFSLLCFGLFSFGFDYKKPIEDGRLYSSPAHQLTTDQPPLITEYLYVLLVAWNNNVRRLELEYIRTV